MMSHYQEAVNLTNGRINTSNEITNLDEQSIQTVTPYSERTMKLYRIIVTIVQRIKCTSINSLHKKTHPC